MMIPAPISILAMVCKSVLVQLKSMTLLWILISYLSKVLVPLPHGLFLVVILRTLVGILLGPLTLKSAYSSFLLLAFVIILVVMSSMALTSLQEMVNLKCLFGCWSSACPFPVFLASILKIRFFEYNPIYFPH